MCLSTTNTPATKANGISDKEWPFATLPLYEAGGTTRSATVQAQAAYTGQAVVVDDINADTRFDFTNVRRRYEQPGYLCQSILNLPLQNRQGDVIGVLELVNARDNAGQVAAFRPEVVSYVSAISSEAAIALDNRRLLKAQKELLDSFIQLIAGAIDAKSPYTSGHCQRVPELARMLAEAAQESHAEPFKDFALSQEQWHELHIASWLHDCGKVTTPEYVVDKATKLECIYNRIHEIRMRFEVLWRDAELAYYKALAAEERDKTALRQQLNVRLQQIQDDFAFVAECNIGGEFMAEERLQRLRKIALQRWLRHLDDRCGLSDDELGRKQHSPQAVLPVEEFILADKAEHIVPRDAAGKPFGDNPYDFRMEIPRHEFNFGELHNLSVPRGTLTEGRAIQDQ